MIAENLRQRIDADEFAVRLPTIPVLADYYDVAEITMRRAIALLKQAGVVTASPKVGIRPTRLKRARTNMIGVVTGGTSGLGAQFVGGVQAVGLTRRQSVLV